PELAASVALAGRRKRRPGLGAQAPAASPRGPCTSCQDWSMRPGAHARDRTFPPLRTGVRTASRTGARHCGRAAARSGGVGQSRVMSMHVSSNVALHAAAHEPMLDPGRVMRIARRNLRLMIGVFLIVI